MSIKNTIFFFFFVMLECGILVPQPGIEPIAPAVGALSPSHCTTREVPKKVNLRNLIRFKYIQTSKCYSYKYSLMIQGK